VAQFEFYPPVRRHPEGPRFHQRVEGSGAHHRDASPEIPRSAWKAAALGMTPSRKVRKAGNSNWTTT